MRSIEQRAEAAMRTAIRKQPTAKQFAKVNCEDNFALALKGFAISAAMDEATKTIDDPATADWLNEVCARSCRKLEAMALKIGREMHKQLKR